MRALWFVCILVLFLLLDVRAAKPTIILLATTSSDSSGFLQYILPIFESDNGIVVRAVIAGSGASLKSGEAGNGDVLLTHSPEDEEAFIAAGFGVYRKPLMYNDFVLIGPSADPAQIGMQQDIFQALRAIADSHNRFVSRADESGTNRREQSLWQSAGVDVLPHSGTWYLETGVGMGMTLNIAVALNAYTLSDRSSWLNFNNKDQHKILFSGGAQLKNQYSLIPISTKKHPHVKDVFAERFIDWMTSPQGQKHIAAYQKDGQSMFTPSSKP